MGLIAVGDIHGCALSLDALLEKIDPGSDDHLVFIGDYVDRGPDSKGVIERLIRLEKTHQCTFLRGNHEAMMLEYLDYGELDLWRMNGGLTTMASYITDGTLNIPPEHIDFVRNTVLYHEEEDFFFVHAGLNAGLTKMDKPYSTIWSVDFSDD
jgi:serine/threonine protein phosphatase 1